MINTMYDLYVISGISESFQAMMGRKVRESNVISDVVLVEQNEFISKLSPMINDIDLALKNHVGELLQTSPVILVGACLSIDLLPVKAKIDRKSVV